jgi:hypothetical protein
MIKIITILFVLIIGFLSIPVTSQVLNRQMIASSVSSKVLKNKIIVSQSIGQLSAAGSYYSPTLIVQQGFQQSSKFVNKGYKQINDLITTVVYPNPVRDYVNFQFSGPVKGKITLMLFDITGRLILTQEKIEVSHTLVTMNELGNLPEGNYIIKLLSPNYKFSANIIKSK